MTLPWRPGHLGHRGAVAGLDDGRVRSSAAHDGTSLVLWDVDRRLAAAWWRDVDALRPWDAGAPLRTALHFALRRADRMLIHAACVGDGESGAILAGPGGSGKSTTTAACMEAGLVATGDDYTVLDTSAAEPRAHTLYRTIKLAAGLGQRAADPEHDGRRTLLVGDSFPGRMAQTLRVAAVVVPRVAAGRTSSLVAITPAEALRAILPSTVFQVPVEPGGDFRPVVGLVSSVPCFRLSLGADRGLPAIVRLLGGDRPAAWTAARRAAAARP